MVTQPTNTRFAIAAHVLTLLSARASTKEATSSARLADSVGSNSVHVRRVLGLLREASLVTSRPGPTGGWRCTRDPASVTLRDVWEAVAGDTQVLGLHVAAAECSVGGRIRTQLGSLERSVAEAMAVELQRTTLAEFLDATDAAAYRLLGA